MEEAVHLVHKQNGFWDAYGFLGLYCRSSSCACVLLRDHTPFSWKHGFCSHVWEGFQIFTTGIILIQSESALNYAMISYGI